VSKTHRNAPFACILLQNFLGRGPSPLLDPNQGDTPSHTSPPRRLNRRWPDL